MSTSPLNRTGYVYALLDPRTDNIRYIGVTVNPMARYYAHCNPYTSPGRKGGWIRQLRRLSLAPQLVIIETTQLTVLREAEQWWISFGNRQKWDLLNERLPTYGIKAAHFPASPIKPIG